VKELWESQQKTVFKTKTIKNIAHQHTEATFRGGVAPKTLSEERGSILFTQILLAALEF